MNRKSSRSIFLVFDILDSKDIFENFVGKPIKKTFCNVLFFSLTVTDDSSTISIPVLQNEEQINLVPYFSKS
jgi:hypothetical protein